jgi:hypothetical protein
VLNIRQLQVGDTFWVIYPIECYIEKRTVVSRTETTVRSSHEAGPRVFHDAAPALAQRGYATECDAETALAQLLVAKRQDLTERMAKVDGTLQTLRDKGVVW